MIDLKSDRLWNLLAWVATFFFGWIVLVEAKGGCDAPAPIAKSVAVSPYRDHDDFITSTRPARRFVEFITRAADAAGKREQIGCAVDGLASWAAADALTAPPDDFEGYRQLIRYSFSLNIAARKIAAAGTVIDVAMVDWLERVSLIVSRYFVKHYKSRGSADNLYVWSGAAAATFLLLRFNPELDSYQRDVWQNAIAAIRSDGTIVQEVRRGAQALVYHSYNLSAILWLKQIRQALGWASTSAENAKIDLLKSLVRVTVCSDERKIEGQSMRQNIPSFTSAGSLYALDRELWNVINECGVSQASDFYSMLGGSMQSTVKILREHRMSDQ